jgi:hypothetical protein
MFCIIVTWTYREKSSTAKTHSKVWGKRSSESIRTTLFR